MGEGGGGKQLHLNIRVHNHNCCWWSAGDWQATMLEHEGIREGGEAPSRVLVQGSVHPNYKEILYFLPYLYWYQSI